MCYADYGNRHDKRFLIKSTCSLSCEALRNTVNNKKGFWGVCGYPSKDRYYSTSKRKQKQTQARTDSTDNGHGHLDGHPTRRTADTQRRDTREKAKG